MPPELTLAQIMPASLPLCVLRRNKHDEQVASHNDGHESSHLLPAKAEEAQDDSHGDGVDIAGGDRGAVWMKDTVEDEGQGKTQEH